MSINTPDFALRPRNAPPFLLSLVVALGITHGTGLDTARAVVIPEETAVGPVEDNTGNGLDGRFYDASDNINSNAQADAIVASNDPTATFIATLVDYPNGNSNTTSSNGTSLEDFLGVDGPSLSGAANTNLTNSVFVFEGFIQIRNEFDLFGGNDTIDVVFAVGSDDGMRLRIGGVTVTEMPSPRSFGFSRDVASFEAEGIYPVELLYWERGGDTGVEWFTSIPGGPDSGAPRFTTGIVPSSILSRSGIPPICDAGGPYEAECTPSSTIIQLSGESSGPQEQQLTYDWKTDCPGSSFSDPNSATPLLEIASVGLPIECEVQLEVKNQGGLSASCSAKITVRDTTPPVASCPAELILEPNQGCDFAGQIDGATATDNCTATGDILLSNDAPAMFPGGTTEVLWTATDESQNSSTCLTLVTVVDSLPPQVTCPENLTTASNSGCDYSGPFGQATATDNCTPAGSIAITNNAPSVFPPGATQVVWTATDESGNEASCSMVVTVVDSEPPQITCPENLTVSSNSGCSYDGPVGQATATDNCTPPGSITVTNDAPSVFPPGATQVVWTATDVAGNTATCSSFVTVIDSEAPTLTCAQDMVVERNAGCNYVGPFGQPTATDNCSSVQFTNDAPGSFPPGSTIITWVSTDEAGNTSTCTSQLTVVDGTPPQIICPGTTTVEANISCGYVGDLPVPAVDDNCSSQEQIQLSNDAPGFLPLGSTKILWTAVDAGGNESSCTTTVLVEDRTPPSLICPPFVTVACTDSAGAIVDFATTVSDNCDPDATMICSPESGSVFPVGSTTVTCTATDASGNENTCSIEVLVQCGGSGGIRPGDCTADGEVGLSDAICLLNVLFLGLETAGLPCGDGDAQDSGNLALMDWDAGADLDITDAIQLLNWLFLGGAPHPLGGECQTIEGCPDSCAL